MARPGHDEGMEDAYFSRPMAANGDEEYYIAYAREEQYQNRQDRQEELYRELCREWQREETDEEETTD